MPNTPPRRTTRTERRVSAWDRVAVALLGAAGFVLSYDALQQMAAAIHVRGPLTYVFPMALDGFIAYGVRALLVLRAAPWPARAYTWLLFASATAASVWANALHAVRLNHLPDDGGGLRLGDSVVGLLSTLAPLALGGAVHLFILITRHGPRPDHYPVPDADAAPTRTATARVSGTPGGHTGDPSAAPDHGVAAEHGHEFGHRSAATLGSVRLAEAGTGGPSATPAGHRSGDRTVEEPARPVELTGCEVAGQGLSGIPADERTGDAAIGPEMASVPGPVGEEHTGTPDGVDGRTVGDDLSGTLPPDRTGRPVGRPPGASEEVLADIGRQAWQRTGRLSRASVRKAVRSQGVTISGDRLTDVMTILRAEKHAADRRDHR
ncbi:MULTISPECIES: DUF2637 domain-containing protein [Kitasatospora]|uniref:DUF2637 domain-containing protein n=1 Tax=Kitasatospora setae (strain ATCC 33774 / DSM 43861 / JCM 3304 / KCC A-0304 / NBRC 14216 / KM-6054) TaxID=452652 RepID=E4NER2_KITSK|nr:MULTISPECIES: DUF2637 domain-containing protein [Kitasatospora]BAJ29848.1 hypothetical protein KSE_40570 [Kitasatospora setae KM-6054]